MCSAGRTELLLLMFKQYLTTEVNKNAVDKNKSSAYHVLAQSGKAHTVLGETLVKMLLSQGCNPNMRDRKNRLAIDYMDPKEPAFTLLMRAGRVT